MKTLNSISVILLVIVLTVSATMLTMGAPMGSITATTPWGDIDVTATGRWSGIVVEVMGNGVSKTGRVNWWAYMTHRNLQADDIVWDN